VDKLNYKKISVGSQDTMFIKKDGTLWGWGYDYKHSAYNLTRISNEKWKDVAVGSSEFGRPSYAIKEDGTLWTITKQSMEKKQGGVTRSVLSGVEIKSISPDHDWKALAELPDSSNNMIFMKQNSKLYGLGFNDSGQLDEPRASKPFKELSVIVELTAINKYYIQAK
jgi:alpha-tubulin suppressor-like RCC1 family protein